MSSPAMDTGLHEVVSSGSKSKIVENSRTVEDSGLQVLPSEQNVDSGLQVRPKSTATYSGLQSLPPRPNVPYSSYQQNNGGAYQPQYQGHYPDDNSPVAEKNEKSSRKKTIFGLSTLSFFLLVALLIVVLVAGIGGGVGGTMAVRNAQKASENAIPPATVTFIPATCPTLTPSNCPTAQSTIIPSSTPKSAPPTTTSKDNLPSTTSSTPTNTLVISSTYPSLLPYNCSALGTTKQLINLDSTSTFDIVCGQDFAPPGPGMVDIVALTMYSMKDCAQACASYNLNNGGTPCKAVKFNAEMEANVRVNLGNCWLKNSAESPVMGSGDPNNSAGLTLVV